MQVCSLEAGGCLGDVFVVETPGAGHGTLAAQHEAEDTSIAIRRKGILWSD